MTASPIDPTGELRGLAWDCVHCGFCLPACPTYQLWGEEMDSPRGRIHLITQLLDGGQASEAAASHLDRCLGCMACVPACPSGVRYDRLIEAARSWQEAPPRGADGAPAHRRRCRPGRPGPRPPARRSSRRSRTRAGSGCSPGRCKRPSGPGWTGWLGRSPLARRLAPELVASLRVAPAPGNGQHRLAAGRVPAEARAAPWWAC